MEHAEVAGVPDAGTAAASVRGRQVRLDKAFAVPVGVVNNPRQGAAAYQDPARTAHLHQTVGVVRVAQVHLGETGDHPACDRFPGLQLTAGDIVAFRRGVEVGDSNPGQGFPGALNDGRRRNLAAEDEQPQAPQRLDALGAVEAGAQQGRGHHDPRDTEAEDGGGQGERIPHGPVPDQHRRHPRQSAGTASQMPKMLQPTTSLAGSKGQSRLRQACESIDPT